MQRMNLSQRFRGLLCTSVFIICGPIAAALGQSFRVEPLVTIPGDNRNLDVLGSPFYGAETETFICWENQLDSVYSIYLQKIGPELTPAIRVYFDTVPNIRPGVAWARLDQGIRVVWQSWKEGFWQLRSRTFKSDSLTPVTDLTVSETDHIDPALSPNRVLWIEDGSLVNSSLYPDWSGPEILDSLDCSRPEIHKIYDDYVVYEKGPPDAKQIYLAQLKDKFGEEPWWHIEQISEDGHNLNPSFGLETGVVFQQLVSGFWQLVYSTFDFSGYFETFKVEGRDLENPFIFNYPIPTLFAQPTPFFVAYDSEVGLGRHDIFIRPVEFSTTDSVVNVSGTAGDDRRPIVAFLNRSDSTEIAILWEHSEGDKREIWWARADFVPVIGSVQEKTEQARTFELHQNYPNPFNAATEISYTLSQSAAVDLSIFNLGGELVATLVHDIQAAGPYSFEWRTDGVSSGVYVVRLEVGEISVTKKCLLLK